MKSRRARAFLAMTLVAGCGGSSSPTAPPAVVAPFEAKAYLNAMLDLMQAHSINRHVIDWTSFRSTVLAAAANATTLAEVYPAISIALGLLRDNHSLYTKATGGFILSPSLPACSSQAFTTAPSVPATIGYVYVGTCFTGCNPQTYATAMHTRIRSMDSAAIEGWIVDLRKNGGGSSHAMVAAVGPILGEGTAGYFIDADQKAIPWGYSSGSYTHGGFPALSVTNPYSLRRPNPTVAVLLDNITASAGEAAAVSFLGRPRTRTFGTATCGLSTGNSTYPLSDGSSLSLTTHIDADRLMRKYGGPLVPDEWVDDPIDLIDRANAWLRSQSAVPQ